MCSSDLGNDPRDFVAPIDNTKQIIQQIITTFKKRREEERKRAEEEKLHNLKQKQHILEKIKALVDSEENDQSLNALREYMREWKEVRQIPKEYQDELYTAYKFQIDKFYNQLSVFNELKELDKDKNLELKIDLIKRAEQLKDEPNIRKALLQLNKYHEDWKNTGPVRAEISEDIWKRFKAASVGAAVTNLVSFTGTADIPGFLPDYFGGQPWDESAAALYRDRSPVMQAKGVTTPTLVQHGEADVRVPVSQGYEFYNALKQQSVPAEMLVLPRQPHGPTEPRMILKIMQTNLELFEKHLRVSK